MHTGTREMLFIGQGNRISVSFYKEIDRRPHEGHLPAWNSGKSRSLFIDEV